MQDEDITDSLFNKIQKTEKNIARKESAEVEMMQEINLGMLTTLKSQISKMNERDKLSKKVKDLLMSRIELNPDELDLPTPYVIKLMEVLMAADSRDTGNFMALMKAEQVNNVNNSSPILHNEQPKTHTSKEEIKEDKKLYEAMESLKSLLDDMAKTEDSEG